MEKMNHMAFSHNSAEHYLPITHCLPLQPARGPSWGGPVSGWSSFHPRNGSRRNGSAHQLNNASKTQPRQPEAGGPSDGIGADTGLPLVGPELEAGAGTRDAVSYWSSPGVLRPAVTEVAGRSPRMAANSPPERLHVKQAVRSRCPGKVAAGCVQTSVFIRGLPVGPS